MPKLTVTDHALMRYIERVLKVDLKPVRREMLNQKLVKEAAAAGASAVKINNFVYLIENDKIITVTDDGDRRCGHNKEHLFKDGYQQSKEERR